MSAATIISHMNRDHRVSLYDYLAYYNGIKLDLDNPRQSVELVDVRLDKLVSNYNENGQLHSTTVALDPPMKSLADARTRFIAMSFKAADGLKVSPYRITKYVRANGRTRLVGSVIVLIFSTLASVTFSPLFAHRLIRSLGVNERWIKSSKLAFYAMITIHTVEFFAKVRESSRFHRLPARLRLAYFLGCVAVGIPCWKPLSDESKRSQAHRAEFEKKAADGSLN